MRLQLLFTLVAVVAIAHVSSAQVLPEGESLPVAIVRAPAPDTDPLVDVEDRPARNVADKKFWLTAAALNAAMIIDTKTTFDVMARCPRCRESDPYAQPFVEHGPGVAYAAGEAFDITVMAVTAKMKGSDRPFFRHTWWVAPIALTAGHLLAAQHNTHVGW
jgi:hypothetical protein